MNLIQKVEKAIIAGVPIVGIESVDQLATLENLRSLKDTALFSWDAIRGLMPLNKDAIIIIEQNFNGDASGATLNPSEMLGLIRSYENVTVVFMNANRFLNGGDFANFVLQGIMNLRESFKANSSMLILLSNMLELPSELQNDVMVFDEELPNEDETKNLVNGILNEFCTQLKIKQEFSEAEINKIVDTLLGLPSFTQEQVLAVSLDSQDGKVIVNKDSLWDRKCKAVAQTRGLSFYRGNETFDDIEGCENIKEYLTDLLRNGNYRGIVFMDEIEKMFAGSEGDLSGTTQKQHGAFLRWTQDNKIDGITFIGHPGAAKSVVGKAASKIGGMPCICMNMDEFQSGIVGSTGEFTRAAFKTIMAVTQGKVLMIATCNKIQTLSPELKRRFKLGTFFFDLPSKEARNKIWQLKIKQFNLGKDQIKEIPDDTDWTGAEIEACCEIASKVKCDLIKASSKVVPVARANPERVETLRKECSGKFIDAEKEGIYRYSTVEETGKRKFGLRN